MIRVLHRGTVSASGILAVVGGVCLSFMPPARAGLFRTVALEDEPAPGVEAGVTFAAFNTAVAVINNSGHTSFRSRVKGPGIVANGNDQGIWSEASGTLDLVARNDDPAPVEGTGVEFKSLFDPQIGNPGATSFSGFIRGTGVVIGSNDMGIWSDASGSLSLVARRGSPAPGLVDVEFSVFNSPVSASTGQSTFFSLLQGSGVGSTDYRSIWSEGGGSLHLVARMATTVLQANRSNSAAYASGSPASASASRWADETWVPARPPKWTSASRRWTGHASDRRPRRLGGLRRRPPGASRSRRRRVPEHDGALVGRPSGRDAPVRGSRQWRSCMSRVLGLSRLGSADASAGLAAAPRVGADVPAAGLAAGRGPADFRVREPQHLARRTLALGVGGHL